MSAMKLFTEVSAENQELGAIYLNPAKILWAVESGSKQVGKTILHFPSTKIAVTLPLSEVTALFPNRLSIEMPDEANRGVYVGVNGIVNLDAITSLATVGRANPRPDAEWIRMVVSGAEESSLVVQVHVSQWKCFLRDTAK